MSRLPVYTENTDGTLEAMLPSAPPDEDSLQDLIGRFPELIGGDGEQLLLLKREQSVPDALNGAARWSLDHLFVTRSAVPVLVEVKRASDTRIRREVIGQLLDYAANGVAYWQAGTLATTFQQQCLNDGVDPDLRLSEFLGDNDGEDFWAQVDANLSAGRLRLVVAADEIPRELARIIEFLNEQMRATVLAVELRYFEASDGRRTLAPKVIGQTERALSAKTGSRTKLEPISIPDWISKHIQPKGEQMLSGANRFLQLVESLGAETSVASTQGSIVSRWPTADGTYAYPFFLGANGRVAIGFGWISSRPGLADDVIRRNFLERFHAAVGGISTTNINGHPSFHADRLNDPDRAKQFHALADELVTAARKSE